MTATTTHVTRRQRQGHYQIGECGKMVTRSGAGAALTARPLTPGVDLMRRQRITLICTVCSSSVEVWPSRAPKWQFCSDACRYAEVDALLTQGLKRCSMCASVKSLSEFVAVRAAKTGASAACKPCYNRQSSERRSRAEYKPTQRALSRRLYWAKRSAGSAPLPPRPIYPQAPKDPLRVKARSQVNNAVQSGRLVKPSQCQQCGASGRIDGHHYLGYGRPLDVLWLCTRCHGLEHRK